MASPTSPLNTNAPDAGMAGVVERNLAERLGIDEAQDPRLGELAQDVAPERVLDQIEASEQRFADRKRHG